MIMGIVILVMFVFLAYSLRYISVQRLEEQREEIVETAIEAAAIQYFASVCVDDALKNGILLIGKQGGTIFDWQITNSQGVPDVAHLVFSGTPVVYGIAPSDLSPLPAYPCFEFIDRPPAFCRYPQQGVIAQFGIDSLPQLDGGPQSIQARLQKYIEAYVVRCIDVNQLAQEHGFSGYAFEAGTPVAHVDFRNTDVVATVDYPLSITIRGEEPISQFVNFRSQLPLRFRHLYTAVKDALRKDVSHVTFNPSLDLNRDAFNGEPVQFSRLNPPAQFRSLSLGENDIFFFEDPSSKIGGKPYTFQIARKNRAPALEYVSKNPSLLVDLYDYLILEGERVDVAPKSADPDEDGVSFRYGGTLGTGTGNFFLSSPIAIPGKYTLSVEASDGPLADKQDVRVLVDRVLRPSFVVRSIYPDVPEGYVSREDPFFIDATATNASLDHYANYTFRWSSQLFAPVTSDYACSRLPGALRCDDPLPLPLIQQLPQQNQYVPASGTTAVTLDVTLEYNNRQQNARTDKFVQVVPCLLHKNPADAPFPYNRADPYLANHACCVGDAANPLAWTIAPPTAECYRKDNSCQPGRFVYFTEKDYCRSGRGNICGDGDAIPETEPTNRCGCTAASECADKAISYGLRPGVGWCHGFDGCQQFCKAGSAIVDVNANSITDQGDICGCTSSTQGKACDKDATNTFDGVCKTLALVSWCSGE